MNNTDVPMAKVIFLAGAPESNSLNWDEDALLQHFQLPLQRFLGEEQDLPSTSSFSGSTSFVIPKWRLLSCHASIDANASPRPSRPKPITQVVPPPGTEAHVDFLEHSLAILDGQETFLVSFSTTSADGDDDTTLSVPSNTPSTTASPTPSSHTIPILLPITPFSSLPSAPHLLSLHPQTPTITLLAAVIHCPPPRTVHLRRHHPPTAKQIHEILLGDDTRANFSVTFWFPAPADVSPQQSPPPPPPLKRQRQTNTNTTATRRTRGDDLRLEFERLRAEVAGLRSGDVVLMQNIALREWRGVVYGSSLERRTGRSGSKAEVLWESVEGGGEVRRRKEGLLPDVVLSKLMRVRRWRDEFVGRGQGEKQGRRKMGEEGEALNGEEVGREDLPVDETQIGKT